MDSVFEVIMTTLLVICIIFLVAGLIGIGIGIYTDVAVDDGIITEIAWREPYTTVVMINKVPITRRHNGYWYIVVHDAESGLNRTVGIRNPLDYKIGEYWHE